jgi:hypothetical protein
VRFLEQIVHAFMMGLKVFGLKSGYSLANEDDRV